MQRLVDARKRVNQDIVRDHEGALRSFAYYKSKVRFKRPSRSIRRIESVWEHPYPSLSPSRGKVSNKMQRYAPTFILCDRAQAHESKSINPTFPGFENSRKRRNE